MRQGLRQKGNAILGQKIGKKGEKGAAMPRTKGECELKSENRKGEDPLCGKEGKVQGKVRHYPKRQGNVFCCVLGKKGKVFTWFRNKETWQGEMLHKEETRREHKGDKAPPL